MKDLNNSLVEALAAIIKPIVREAVHDAMNLIPESKQRVVSDKSFLTVKQAAETSGLGASTIRLYIRKRKLKAQQVGRRVIINRTDLEKFLESKPIEAVMD